MDELKFEERFIINTEKLEAIELGDQIPCKLKKINNKSAGH